MKTLVLSDIHANAPALMAVLQAAPPCERVVFLGDLANFGPHPSECVDLLQACDPICIMGNHDEQIISDSPEHFWDIWSKSQLSTAQQAWMATFHSSLILDGHILLIHGAYSVKYDILPNTPDAHIWEAFKNVLLPGIDQVWFGHYHYQVDRVINGVSFHCIRPVGHHRDKDTRASYYICENDVLTQKRVTYELSKTIEDFNKIEIFEGKEGKKQFAELLENAFHDELLKKDIMQMKLNEKTAQ